MHSPTISPAIVAEERAAVQHSEAYLADFRDGWSELRSDFRPVALRYALNHLVVTMLAEPVRAEIWLRDVATAAALPKPELRRLIQRRVDICRNYRELWQRNRAAVESEVIGWML